VWRSTALTCAVFVLASAYTAQAGINVWTSYGPPGGLTPASVIAVAIDPRTPTTLYAGTDTRYAGTYAFGLIKSTDGGTIWATMGLPSLET